MSTRRESSLMPPRRNTSSEGAMPADRASHAPCESIRTLHITPPHHRRSLERTSRAWRLTRSWRSALGISLPASCA